MSAWSSKPAARLRARRRPVQMRPTPVRTQKPTIMAMSGLTGSGRACQMVRPTAAAVVTGVALMTASRIQADIVTTLRDPGRHLPVKTETRYVSGFGYKQEVNVW